jgi:hypothetical protein
LSESATIIYGRVFVSGLTGTGSVPVGLIGQIGVGPAGTDPALNSGWTWAWASFNQSVGNDDEYRGPIPTAHASGMYDYAYRFEYQSGPVAYADLAPGTSDGYSTANAGKLTVSGDVIHCDRFEP